MAHGQALGLVAQILDMVVSQVLPVEADQMCQEITGATETTEFPHAAVLSHPHETPDSHHAPLCPPTRRGMERNPTDLMGEMIDETSSAKAAQEVGQITLTHMFQTTTTAMIARETLVSMALQIPIGAHQVDAITDVNPPGGEVEALALEMGVEDEVQKSQIMQSLQFYVASKSLCSEFLVINEKKTFMS